MEIIKNQLNKYYDKTINDGLNNFINKYTITTEISHFLNLAKQLKYANVLGGLKDLFDNFDRKYGNGNLNWKQILNSPIEDNNYILTKVINSSSLRMQLDVFELLLAKGVCYFYWVIFFFFFFVVCLWFVWGLSKLFVEFCHCKLVNVYRTQNCDHSM